MSMKQVVLGLVLCDATCLGTFSYDPKGQLT